MEHDKRMISRMSLSTRAALIPEPVSQLPAPAAKEVIHSGRLYQLFTVVLSAVIAFSLDRAAKLWAFSHLIFGEESAYWPGVLQFRLTNNTGAAFSLRA
jgi:hypothetical protein